MLLPQIKAFVRVAQAKSVSKAARSLALSQPALTARLQALERDVGANLFERTRYGIRLTEAGQAFLPFAERALAAVDDGLRHVQGLMAGSTGEIVVASTGPIGSYILPPYLKRFQAGHPRVRISLHTNHSEEVLAMVVRGEVDIGIGRAIGHPDVEASLLCEDDLLVVVSSDHPLAGQTRVPPQVLEAETLILFDPRSTYRGLLSSLLGELGVTPQETFTVDHIETAKRMAAMGLGASILPRCSVQAELESGALRSIEVIGIHFPTRRVVVMRRKDAGPPEPPLSAFVATLFSRSAAA